MDYIDALISKVIMYHVRNGNILSDKDIASLRRLYSKLEICNIIRDTDEDRKSCINEYLYNG